MQSKSFQHGLTNFEDACFANEQDVHRRMVSCVKISREFLAVTLVFNAQFKAFNPSDRCTALT